MTSPHAKAQGRFSLFDTVPPDLMGFGLGASFNGKAVQTFLSLKKEDVSRLADVSPKSVRFDDAMPEPVRERLQEIGITINLVPYFSQFSCFSAHTRARARFASRLKKRP